MYEMNKEKMEKERKGKILWLERNRVHATILKLLVINMVDFVRIINVAILSNTLLLFGLPEGGSIFDFINAYTFKPIYQCTQNIFMDQEVCVEGERRLTFQKQKQLIKLKVVCCISSIKDFVSQAPFQFSYCIKNLNSDSVIVCWIWTIWPLITLLNRKIDSLYHKCFLCLFQLLTFLVFENMFSCFIISLLQLLQSISGILCFVNDLHKSGKRRQWN